MPQTNNGKVNVLLLENIHQDAKQFFENEKFKVELLSHSLSEDELCDKIHDVHILGTRSKTSITEKVLNSAQNLLSIGAYCIGTNHIDLNATTNKGIVVFNAPYSNTRSVVELALAEIIILIRQVAAKSHKLHKGIWDKSAKACHEIRGKKLGIIGYGNIGSQLSVLAEALGMQVYYYDRVEKLALGNAIKCKSLGELLQSVDIVTTHVAGMPENKNLIGDKELSHMQPGSIFLNLSRGFVVDLEALAKHLKSGHIKGAAIDVFPVEPHSNHEPFTNVLQGIDNVILTPHIGGSTEEAQCNIAHFVTENMINYVNRGDTLMSVNFPEVRCPELIDAHRLIHIHKNVPGVLAHLNELFASHKINIVGQYLQTNNEIGYVITDISKEYDADIIHKIEQINATLKFRVLY